MKWPSTNLTKIECHSVWTFRLTVI